MPVFEAVNPAVNMKFLPAGSCFLQYGRAAQVLGLLHDVDFAKAIHAGLIIEHFQLIPIDDGGVLNVA